MENIKISFIGGGNIATAIINGILKSEIIKAENINMYDMIEEKKAFFKNLGLTISESECDAAENCDYLFLTIKPQVYDDVLKKIKDSLNKKTIIITVAPGITMNHVKSIIGNDMRIIRTMPNTPALVGEGVTAYVYSNGLNEDEKEFAKNLLNSFSEAYYMEENLLDNIISVSGSSPAYVYMFIDAIAKSGEMQGIDYKTALKMAAKTVIGSAKLLLSSDDSAEVLIDKVCSKGGTTIEAVNCLKENNFYDIIDNAMKKCTKRAIEMRK